MENKPEEIKSPEVQKERSLSDVIKQSILEAGNKAYENFDNQFGVDVFGPVTEERRQEAKLDAMTDSANHTLRELFGSPKDYEVTGMIYAASQDLANSIIIEQQKLEYNQPKEYTAESLPVEGVFR